MRSLLADISPIPAKAGIHFFNLNKMVLIIVVDPRSSLGWLKTKNPKAKLAKETKINSQYFPGQTNSKVDRCKLEIPMATNHTDSISHKGANAFRKNR